MIWYNIHRSRRSWLKTIDVTPHTIYKTYDTIRVQRNSRSTDDVKSFLCEPFCVYYIIIISQTRLLYIVTHYIYIYTLKTRTYQAGTELFLFGSIAFCVNTTFGILLLFYYYRCSDRTNLIVLDTQTTTNTHIIRNNAIFGSRSSARFPLYVPLPPSTCCVVRWGWSSKNRFSAIKTLSLRLLYCYVFVEKKVS